MCLYMLISVPLMPGISCGCNRDDYHYSQVKYGRDFTATAVLDPRSAEVGRPLPTVKAIS